MITATISLEGKFPAAYRETAEAEAESVIINRLKALPAWLHLIKLNTTATRRIL